MVAALKMFLALKLLKEILEHSTFRVIYHQADSGIFIYLEEFQLPADLAVVPFLGLLKTMEVNLKFLLVGK